MEEKTMVTITLDEYRELVIKVAKYEAIEAYKKQEAEEQEEIIRRYNENHKGENNNA